MNQLSSITPLEIILIGSAAVGVFLFFRACWRNIKRSRQHLGVALLTLVMTLTAQTAWAQGVTEIEVSSWDELKSVSTVNGSTVTLTQCIKTTAELTISETVTLDLNGYGIRTTSSGDFIMIGNGGNLTLKDDAAVKPTRYITIDGFYGSAVSTSVPSGKYLTVNGGYITGAHSSAVTNKGTFTMAGGTLCGNGTAGIYAYSTTTLAGGTITGNHTTGVSLNHNNAELKMTGGTITGHNDVKNNGAGVSISLGKFIMTGGSITGNTTSSNYVGGGVNVKNGTCIIAGGTVSGNTAGSGNGNNIYSKNSTDVYIFPGCVDGGIGQSSSTYAPKQFSFGTGTDGSDAKPFVISDAAGWNAFCTLINNDIYRNKHFELGDDISVTQMAGDTNSTQSFTGTFDGKNHSLDFNVTASERNTAPFLGVMGATIRNLHVTGTITTNYQFAAGIVVSVFTPGLTIENCRSSVTINSTYKGEGFHGGILSRVTTGTANITGCVFDGKIITGSTDATKTTACGGFVGVNTGTVNITDCLYAPAALAEDEKYAKTESYLFVLNGTGGSSTFTRSYYTEEFGTAQGIAPRTVTAGDDVTVSNIALTGNVTSYTTSGITAYSGGGITYDGNLYYGDGDDVSLTLSHTGRTGYFFTGYSASAGTLSGTTLTMPNKNVTISANWADPNDFSVNAAGDEYTIKTAAGWNNFCDLVNSSTSLTGKTVKLGNSISATRMAGSGSKPFTGTFNGQGNTLTVNFSATTHYCAPFCYVSGSNASVMIKNLHIAGAIITNTYMYGAGIVGKVMDNGNVTIDNCRSSVVIQSDYSGNGRHSGFVSRGDADATISIKGCVFDGSINAANSGQCAGFLASKQNSSVNVTIENCLFAPTVITIAGNDNKTFARGNNNSITNCYYTQALSTDQGTLPRTVTAGDEYVAVAAVTPVGNATATYTTSGIAAYAKGIKRDGTFYYGNGDDVSLTLSHSNRTGYFFTGYSASAGTLSGTTLTMPDEDVTISANWADPNDFSVNAAGTEYTIKTAKGWDAFCYLLDDNSKGYFTSKTVKLAPSSGNSISVTRMAGSSSHKFTGTFDGDGKTLTVSYGTEAAPVSEEYAAPFRFVDGATIQNLHVEGSIISTVRRAAGVIGETGDNTSHITNCVSSSTISGGNFTGGFSIGGNVEIDGCVYNGKINGSGNSGGFVGYSQPTLKITNCLFAPQSGSSISGGTFYYNGGGNITPVNSYYTQKLGTAQGKQAYEVSAAPELLGEGTGSGIVKTYGDYGLGFNKKYYLATIPLSETEGVIYLTDYLQGLEVPVVFKRTFSAGKASTICLPFAMDNASGGKVYSFAGITYDEKDGWVATMSETETDGNNVTSTKANTPYVFMPDADGEVTFSGTTDEIPAAYDAKELSTVSGDWTFQGTYEQLKYGSNLDGHVYGFASRDKEVDGVNVAAGEFVKAKDGAGVKPMRCYLTYKNGDEFVAGARAVTRGIEENLPQSITVKFVSSTGNTTAIATLNTQTGEITTDDAWYTLSGTRLPGKPTRRGIYINNGKAVYIKH